MSFLFDFRCFHMASMWFPCDVVWFLYGFLWFHVVLCGFAWLLCGFMRFLCCSMSFLCGFMRFLCSLMSFLCDFMWFLWGGCICFYRASCGFYVVSFGFWFVGVAPDSADKSHISSPTSVALAVLSRSNVTPPPMACWHQMSSLKACEAVWTSSVFFNVVYLLVGVALG